MDSRVEIASVWPGRCSSVSEGSSWKLATVQRGRCTSVLEGSFWKLAIVHLRANPERAFLFCMVSGWSLARAKYIKMDVELSPSPIPLEYRAVRYRAITQTLLPLEEMNRFESSSSDSSIDIGSSSDDELLEALYPPRRQRIASYVEDTVPGYTNGQFLEHFRISRRLTLQIAERFEASEDYRENATGGNGKLSALKYILVFLWFAGHQTASFRDVSDRFDIALSTLHHVIKVVTVFISNLAPEVVIWPNPEEQVAIEAHFARQGFPGAIGAIDGSHVKIDKPAEDEESYYNRKQYHSIQLQAVCDHRRRIRDLFVGYPGSVHDARVFRNSPLWVTINENCREGFFILGDSAYPCQPHLLTPFKDRGNLTRRQRNFNFKHSSSRYVIEHCFSLLKQKFRQLYHIKLQSIETIVHFIRACCVLHNLQLDDDEFVIPEEQMEPAPVENVGREPGNVEHDEENLPSYDCFQQLLSIPLSLRFPLICISRIAASERRTRAEAVVEVGPSFAY